MTGLFVRAATPNTVVSCSITAIGERADGGQGSPAKSG